MWRRYRLSKATIYELRVPLTSIEVLVNRNPRKDFLDLGSGLLTLLNPFSAGTAFMLMQTGWIQASCRVTQRLA